MSRRVYAHSKAKKTTKPFRPAKEAMPPTKGVPTARSARAKRSKGSASEPAGSRTSRLRASKGPGEPARPRSVKPPKPPKPAKPPKVAQVPTSGPVGPEVAKPPRTPRVVARATATARAAGSAASAAVGWVGRPLVSIKGLRSTRTGTAEPVGPGPARPVQADRDAATRPPDSGVATGRARGLVRALPLRSRRKADATVLGAAAAADGPGAGHQGVKGLAGKARTGKPATDKTATGKPTTGKAGTGKGKRPVSAPTRRNRLPVAVAALCALLILVAGFPASGLLSQHQQQSAASAQLAQLRLENKRLAEQERALDSKTEITRLARQDYQLVHPGETLYDVLPAAGENAGKHTSTTAPGGVEAGDPGDQPLVSPSDAPDMSPDPGLPQGAITPPSSGGTDGSGSSSHAVGAGSSSTFWGRVVTTLEFWQ